MDEALLHAAHAAMDSYRDTIAEAKTTVARTRATIANTEATIARSRALLRDSVNPVAEQSRF